MVPAPAVDGEPFVASRFLQLRFGWHVALLALVLMGGMWIVRPLAAASTDEGAAILQAQHLADGRGWVTGPSDASIDPLDQGSLLLRSDRGSNGNAYYAKHPLYPLLLSWVLGPFGRAGLFLLTAGAALLAAITAALITRRLDPKLDCLGLWLTGVGSPLFFYSYFVVAHTLVAAATGTAAVFVLRVRDEKSFSVSAAAIAASCCFAAAIRSEGLILGPALLVGCSYLAWQSTNRRRQLAMCGVGAFASSLIAFGLERVAVTNIIGRSISNLPTTSDGFVAGRWHGFVATWLTPSYLEPKSDVLLYAALVLVLGAGAARQRKHPGLGAGALLAVAAIYGYRWAVDGKELIPGLLFTVPVAVFALLGAGAHAYDTAVARFLAVSACSLIVGVLLTQYSFGGGREWGGRFFALAWPLVMPVVALALEREVLSGGRAERIAAGATALTTVFLASIALTGLRASHEAAHELELTVNEAVNDVPDAVFVWAEPLYPQAMWGGVDQSRWLIPRGKRTTREVLSGLQNGGVETIALVSASPVSDGADLAPRYSVDRTYSTRISSEKVTILRRTLPGENNE